MITLYSHISGPNGLKVVIVLKELGLDYEVKYLSFMKGEHKAPEYTKYNPNGRIPCIVDHDNNDFVLWESIAIIQYLVKRYDKENKISYSTENEVFQTLQWLSFQVSGQGPYFGQAAWFARLHHEKLPSAIERYQKEIDRVLGVLDSVLAKQKYLVGDKVTVADLAFVPWNRGLAPWTVGFPCLLEGSNIDIKRHVNFVRWNEELLSRPSVVKAFEERVELSKSGLPM